MLRGSADWAFACGRQHDRAMRRDADWARTSLPLVHTTIVTLVFNEAAWLSEWLEHHKLVGVDRFVLYDVREPTSSV